MSSAGILTFVSFLNSSTAPAAITVETSNYPIGANESYQSNPVDNQAYSSQVGTTPNSYITLNADRAMTIYYDTSSDAQTWTSAVHTYNYSPGVSQTYTAMYPNVEYERYRVINGSTAATVTNIAIGLQA